MKLKNLKKDGKKKQAKKEQPKQQVQKTTNYDDEQDQRDDALVDLKEDIQKKQQPKNKPNKRIQSNLLQETQIDTSKLLAEKKQIPKQALKTWVVEATQVKNLLAKDFNMDEVDHEFESLTDQNINEELRKKKQAMPPPKFKEDQIGIKFAPMTEVSIMDSKGDNNLQFSNSSSSNSSIGSPILTGLTPTMKFTNTNFTNTVNIAPLQKSAQQLREQEIEIRMLGQKFEKKNSDEPVKNSFTKISIGGAKQSASASKGGWFKKICSDPVPNNAIQFKSSNLNFTNSNMGNGTGKFKDLQKSKQQLLMEEKAGKTENLKIRTRQEIQEGKKRQADRLAQQEKAKKSVGLGGSLAEKQQKAVV